MHTHIYTYVEPKKQLPFKPFLHIQRESEGSSLELFLEKPKHVKSIKFFLPTWDANNSINIGFSLLKLNNK